MFLEGICFLSHSRRDVVSSFCFFYFSLVLVGFFQREREGGREGGREGEKERERMMSATVRG